ncbi:hypothetical protein CC2G_000170 [Coprinopsis cinerea AmutBmut pab1-1]|nr:hypothetical protein CC2G_000170 [Coprinopsis cinerea AmutBmut pab1-1]
MINTSRHEPSTSFLRETRDSCLALFFETLWTDVCPNLGSGFEACCHMQMVKIFFRELLCCFGDALPCRYRSRYTPQPPNETAREARSRRAFNSSEQLRSSLISLRFSSEAGHSDPGA